jgi:hypothetical protein
MDNRIKWFFMDAKDIIMRLVDIFLQQLFL